MSQNRQTKLFKYGLSLLNMSRRKLLDTSNIVLSRENSPTISHCPPVSIMPSQSSHIISCVSALFEKQRFHQHLPVCNVTSTYRTFHGNTQTHRHVLMGTHINKEMGRDRCRGVISCLSRLVLGKAWLSMVVPVLGDHLQYYQYSARSVFLFLSLHHHPPSLSLPSIIQFKFLWFNQWDWPSDLLSDLHLIQGEWSL